jgi:hypothetical protein
MFKINLYSYHYRRSPIGRVLNIVNKRSLRWPMSQVVSTDTSSDDEVVLVKVVPPPPVSREDVLVLCKVCLVRKVSQILFPCRHACICDECFDKLDCPKQCPVCRTMVFRNVQFILDCWWISRAISLHSPANFSPSWMSHSIIRAKFELMNFDMWWMIPPGIHVFNARKSRTTSIFVIKIWISYLFIRFSTNYTFFFLPPPLLPPPPLLLVNFEVM